MKSDRLLTLATLLALLGGCATAPREAAPPVRQVQADPFAGFERTRNEETALMEKARLEIIALLSSSPGARQITVEPLQYASLEVTDLRSQQRRSFRVASHFAISMPLAIKKQPAYEQCTEKVRKLAEYLADTRQAAEIMFFYNNTDARTQKINLENGVANSPGGHPISVTKSADGQIARGSMRLVIKAAPLRNSL